MSLSVIGAAVAGLASTLVMSITMAVAPRMDLPPMDFAGWLANLLGVPRLRALGFVAHLLIGVGWAFAYAALWSAGIGSPDVTIGLLFGIAHWLIAGALFGLLPSWRPGMPGLYFRNLNGNMGFFGGLMLHIIYGLTMGLVYQFFHP